MAIDPRGRASDPSGILYFISSNCVFKLDQNGVVTRAAGSSRMTRYSGDGGPAVGAELRTPSGIAIDAAGDIFIADASDYRVRKVSPDGLISTVAGTGVQGYSGDGASATSAQLSRPTGLTTDTKGDLFIVDGVRVRKVSLSGTITTVAGNGTIGFSGDGGPATGAQLNSPYGVAVDSAGILYISDDGSLRVRKVSPNGIITTVAGTGVSGSAGDGGPAMSAQLTGATGIAVDTSGNLYLAESNSESGAYECPSCIRKISAAGTITTVAVGLGLIEPRALATDQAGTLYIAETGTGRIRKISPEGFTSIVAGNGATTSYGGDGGPVTGAQFFWPTGVAVDADGTVYVADTFNNRVRAVSPAGIIASFAVMPHRAFPATEAPPQMQRSIFRLRSQVTGTETSSSRTMDTRESARSRRPEPSRPCFRGAMCGVWPLIRRGTYTFPTRAAIAFAGSRPTTPLRL